MEQSNSEMQFALCIKNDDYAASLEVRKVYQMLSDALAAEHQLVRIVDETGEDYLYPQSYFVPLVLPAKAVQVFVAARV